MGNDARQYGVDLVRGEVVRPDPHPGSCESVDALKQLAQESTKPLAADLFCGAGGLSLGLTEAGFDVVVGVDTDEYALETHGSLFPGLHLNWDLADPSRVEAIVDILSAIDVTLIAGGPPCQPFSKAGRSMIRDLVRQGRRPPEDARRDLWQSFLAVVEHVQPPAVLMENVPDMALDRDMLILRTMVDELERLGYGVDTRVLETSKYGVPQHRQRLILVALRDRRNFEWPDATWGRTAEAPLSVTLRDAIADLPDVEPGWQSAGADGLDYEGPRSEFQKKMRAKVADDHQNTVYDHVTRSVREDDRQAFELLETGTRYSALPSKLKRYRDDIFDDKYKRLSYDDLCRTITAHIAKDGYWYIHPVHHRTLTIREAARVQTFSDDVRFAGPPTAALRQIGNAVPPALGEHLGQAILEALGTGHERSWTTREVSAELAHWWSRRQELVTPWLAPLVSDGRVVSDEMGRWVVIQAETLLARATPDLIRAVWPRISQLVNPEATIAKESELRWLFGKPTEGGRAARVDEILQLARGFQANPKFLESRDGLSKVGVTDGPAELAMRVYPDELEDPVIAPVGVLRVAARFNGSAVHRRNRNTDGRIELARLIGVDPAFGDADQEGASGTKAHLALLELSASLCRADVQYCEACPLERWCHAASFRGAGVLPLSSTA